MTKKNETAARDLGILKETIQYKRVEDANDIIRELNKTLQLVNIDIAGIKAKLEKIKNQETSIPANDKNKELLNILYQMRLTQEIELAGASAREKATQSALETASRFITLSKTTTETAESLKTKQKKLNKVQFAINNYEKMLSDLPWDMKPAELIDNKITIYQLSY
jgi:nitrogenase subunit NifH